MKATGFFARAGKDDSLLFRFSLYGFLKNQRYFEPFIILFFLDKGLSFTLIGLLVAIREFSTNLMEIPSGALADLYGRRRVMIVSFAAYLVSFFLFATGEGFWQFALAMVLYAGGDAFRTGTHKAMIFTWLRHENRLDEKTRVYGITRSWSKMGAAVSLIPATACVFWLRDYAFVFYFAMIPYVLGIINFLFYPAWLDGPPRKASVREVWSHLGGTLRLVLAESRLRRLILESMTYEGMFKAGKDYLQPIVKQAALAVPILVSLETESRTALLLGLVYFAEGVLDLHGQDAGGLSGPYTLSVTEIGGQVPGDFNGDGVADLDDFVILKQNFMTPGTLAEGDADGSGFVDLDDFVILKQNFMAASPAASASSCFRFHW